MRFSCCKRLLLIIMLFLAVFCSQAFGEELFEDQVELIRDGFLPEKQQEELIVFRGESFEDYMAAKIEALATDIDISQFSMTPSAFRTAYSNLIDLRPDLFYAPSQYAYYAPQGVITRVFFISYPYTKDEIEVKREAYEAALSEIVALTDQASTPLGKIMIAHDYLCAHYEYDMSYQVYSAEAMFRTGVGVCQAYLQAFQAVMNELDIPCVPVTSAAMGHGWNAVCVDGSWYHVDTTWDDPVSSSEYPLRAWHHFFMLSDTELARNDHYYWTSSVQANSTKYDNWFWHDYNTAIPVVDDVMYYVDPESAGINRTIKAWDMAADTISEVCTYSIRAVDGTAYALDGYYPLSATDTHLYYMATDRVYALPLDGGEAKLAFALEKSRYIWSAVYDGSRIELYVANSSRKNGEILTFSGTEAQISLNYDILHLHLDDSECLTACFTPGSAEEFTWKSSNADVVSVNKQGKIDAVSTGTSLITVDYAGEAFASCIVVVHGNTALTLPASMHEIGSEAFAGSGVEEVILPEGVERIADRAFADCECLYCITIPATVTEIADNAFENDDRLVLVCERGSYAEAFAIEKGLLHIEQ